MQIRKHITSEDYIPVARLLQVFLAAVSSDWHKAPTAYAAFDADVEGSDASMQLDDDALADGDVPVDDGVEMGEIRSVLASLVQALEERKRAFIHSARQNQQVRACAAASVRIRVSSSKRRKTQSARHPQRGLKMT